jgi:Sec-independent protein translocase protein TatA
MATSVDILIVLVIVLIVVFVWRGPTMLPRIGEALGRTVKGVRENLPGARGNGPDGGAGSGGGEPPRA